MLLLSIKMFQVQTPALKKMRYSIYIPAALPTIGIKAAILYHLSFFPTGTEKRNKKNIQIQSKKNEKQLNDE